MSIENIIIASVMSKDVFRRFAKVSPKDKEKIVEKVKEKVNGKGKKKPAKKEEAPAEEIEVTDDAVDALKETPAETPKEEAPKDKPDVEKPAVETSITDEEVPDEEVTNETEDIPGMEDIVGDLVEEVEAIKSDGHIAPEEVLGLIDNMVQMVQSLLTAKPGRARKTATAQRVREEVIAERIIQ